MIGIPSVNASVSLRSCVSTMPITTSVPCCSLLLRRLQHRVGLPHPRRHSEENLQLAARGGRFLALHLREDLIRIRAIRLTHLRIVRLNLTKFQTRLDPRP